MRPEYQQWIDGINEDVKSKCAEYTLKMQSVFPELIRVRGFYYCPRWLKSAHWWLKTADGEIVDPTARQFMRGGEYEEWDETQPEPTGMCPNCGGHCYDNRSVCSDKCSREYTAYLMSETR